MDISSLITLALSIFSLLVSSGALFVTWRAAYSDRINTNTWETYETYNSELVRNGRAAARTALKDVGAAGFADFATYRRYFHLDDPPESTDKISLTRRQQEQHLHDLLAFYHQVGLLLQKGRLDKDFTLLLLGAGLHDRWKLLGRIPAFYAEPDDPKGDFPYGGVYVLYNAYCSWQGSRFVELKQNFKQARDTAEKLAATVRKSL